MAVRLPSALRRNTVRPVRSTILASGTLIRTTAVAIPGRDKAVVISRTTMKVPTPWWFFDWTSWKYCNQPSHREHSDVEYAARLPTTPVSCTELRTVRYSLANASAPASVFGKRCPRSDVVVVEGLVVTDEATGVVAWLLVGRAAVDEWARGGADAPEHAVSSTAVTEYASGRK